MIRSTRRHTLLLLVALLTLTALAGPASPARADLDDERMITALDGASGDMFGKSVDVDGDNAVIGAPFHGADDSGAAYAYRRVGGMWAEESGLVPSGSAANAKFGNSVAVSGDTIVVAAGGTGRVFVFVRGGASWTEQQELLPPDDAPNAYFGWSVAIDGDTIAVGAYQGSTVYVYTRSGGVWTSQGFVTAGDGPGGGYGWDVDVAGNTIVVGAFTRGLNTVDGYLADAGAAYIYMRSGGVWTEQKILHASNKAAGDEFGSSVSIVGSTLVVGAPKKDYVPGEGSIGAAYVFTRGDGTWPERTILEASDGVAGDSFGTSVAMGTGKILIGAEGWADSLLLEGAAYLYVGSGADWAESKIITATNGVGAAFFGTAVAISDGTALVGARGRNAFRGAAYVYQPPLCHGRVSTIVGTPGGDILVGTEEADVISGLAGGDVIYGLGGDDYICAGAGPDQVFGGPGQDHIWGGSGPDTISAGRGSDWVSGGRGDDDLAGGRGNDSLFGGPGIDLVNGGPGLDKCEGEAELKCEA